MTSYSAGLWGRLSPTSVLNFAILAIKQFSRNSTWSHRRRRFSSFFLKNFRPEVVCDVRSGLVLDQTGTDVYAKCGDFMSNRSRYLQAARSVMNADDERQLMGGHGIRQKRHLAAFCLKMASGGQAQHIRWQHQKLQLNFLLWLFRRHEKIQLSNICHIQRW